MAAKVESFPECDDAKPTIPNRVNPFGDHLYLGVDGPLKLICLMVSIHLAQPFIFFMGIVC